MRTNLSFLFALCVDQLLFKTLLLYVKWKFEEELPDIPRKMSPHPKFLFSTGKTDS
jgi:hypothetical protein